MNGSTARALVAEFSGTFVLVFAGTGAIVVDSISGGRVTHVGVALVFGLVVLALIEALGDVSGAHFNPAVTCAFVAGRAFPVSRAALYIGVQVLGAVAASGFLSLVVGSHVTLGATLPSGSALQSFTLEIVLSWILMFVILAVSDGARERGTRAAISIGAVVALEALFAGPISGASMNPARSLGPALVSGATEHVWVYLTAPVIGALLAVPTCRLLRSGDCCAGKGTST